MFVIDVIRLIVGSLMALFIPGFALSQVFFFRIKEINYKERVALSLSLSFIITIFISFAIGGNKAVADITGGANGLNYWISITLISIILFGIAIHRRKRAGLSAFSLESAQFLTTYRSRDKNENGVFDLCCVWWSFAIVLVLGSTWVLVSSFYRLTLPGIYFIGYTFIAVSIAILIVKKSRLSFFAIVIFGILLRIFPLIGQSKIFSEDVTLNYGVAMIFEHDQYFHPILAEDTFIEYMTKQYSGFPGIHMYAIATNALTAISISYLSFIVLPTIFSIIQFLFMEQITNAVFKNAPLSNMKSMFALFIFTIWPMSMYIGTKGFEGQNGAFTLMLAMIYYFILSVTSDDRQKSNVYAILYFLFYCGIVVSHHLTTAFVIFLFVFMGILLALLKVFLTLRPDESRNSFLCESSFRSLVYQFRIYSVLPFIAIAFLYWFTWPREIIFMWYDDVGLCIDSLLNALSGNFIVRNTMGTENFFGETALYTRLIPTLRNLVLGILALYGLWVSLKRFKKGVFIMLSMMVFALIMTGFGAFGITLAPDRNFLFLVLPFATFSGCAVTLFYNKGSSLSKVLGLTCIIFLVLSSSFSLWCFTNSPLNVYAMSDDPLYATVTSTPLMINLQDVDKAFDWLNEDTNPSGSYYLATDNALLMALVLSKNATTYSSVIYLRLEDLRHLNKNMTFYIVDRPYIDQEEALKRMEMKIAYRDEMVTIYEAKWDNVSKSLDSLISILRQGGV